MKRLNKPQKAQMQARARSPDCPWLRAKSWEGRAPARPRQPILHHTRTRKAGVLFWPSYFGHFPILAISFRPPISTLVLLEVELSSSPQRNQTCKQADQASHQTEQPSAIRNNERDCRDNYASHTGSRKYQEGRQSEQKKYKIIDIKWRSNPGGHSPNAAHNAGRRNEDES